MNNYTPLHFFSAGHRLALHKCSWCLFKIRRNGLTHGFETATENRDELALKEGFHLTEKIMPQLEPNISHETLGHWISSIGDCSEQLKNIQAKTNHWSSRIGTSSLSRIEKIMAYTGYLLPPVKYKIVSTNLNFE